MVAIIQNRNVNEKESSTSAAAKAELQIQSIGEDKEKDEVVSQSTDQLPRDAEKGQDDLPAEPPSELQAHMVQSAGEDYSVLTVTQKRLIVMTASLASLFSPMATAIYCQFPTLTSSMSSADSIRSIS